MTAQINSPFLLSKLRPIAELSRSENNYHEQLERILQQIYRRVGGTTDTVDGSVEESSANENQIAHLYGLIDALTRAVNDLSSDSVGQLDTSGFRSKTVTSSYTATDHDFINAKRGAVISLPQYPVENSVIIVRNGDGSAVGLNGSGKNINGSGTGSIQREGTALVLHYFIDSDEWLVR